MDATLPKGIIMTPHARELDRLTGSPANADYERLHRTRELAKSLQAYIILKGHNSALCLPNGNVIFNSTGNSGMATAGSGDVLTGIITSPPCTWLSSTERLYGGNVLTRPCWRLSR